MRTRLFSLFVVVALIVAVTFGAWAMTPTSSVSAQDPGLVSTKPILVSGARTTTGVSNAVCGIGQFKKFAVQQVVTAASGTTPTLTTTIQHSIDGGTTWYTWITMTQATAATTELKVESEVEAATAEVVGDCVRASYVIGGTTPSFTFSVLLQAQT